jgi:DNA-binding NarL/FixJ family response regulator
MTADRAVDYALAIDELAASMPPNPTLPDATVAVDGHPGGLTTREREVAALIAQGYSNQRIAAALVISPRTAMRHVEHILTKLGMHSRAQVAAWAVRHLPASSREHVTTG